MVEFASKRSLTAAFILTAIIVPSMWMLTDREPPFVREGEIVPAEPGYCKLTADAPRGIRPGSCVELKLKVKVLRNCSPRGVDLTSHQDNITRHVRDSTGITKSFGTTRGYFGDQGNTPTDLDHYFIVPQIPPGPATLITSACFACNPLQHLFWPVCVDKPDIDFEVEK